MAELLDSVCTELEELCQRTEFVTILLFGSLIHKGGVQFDINQSDIDTICPFKPEIGYLGRWNAVRNAQDPVSHLNLKLLRLLKRSDASKAIVSVVPVTNMELELGMHKDKSAQFFSHNKFLNISDKKISSAGGEYKLNTPELEGAFDSIRETQKFRNKFLEISPSGIRSVDDYNGPDVLPKALLRCSAQLRWARNDNSMAGEQRFDVNEGLIYILQLLTARRNEATEVDDLLQRVAIRMGGRGDSAALSISDQLLLWEILSDDCLALVPGDISAKPTKSFGVPAGVKTKLFMRSNFCCSFPGCNTPLGEDGIGEIAHIQAATETGPRYNPDLDQKKVNGIDNLIVLCPTHHRLIDKKPEVFSTEILNSWNAAHKDSNTQSLPFSSKDLFTIVRIILNMIT